MDKKLLKETDNYSKSLIEEIEKQYLKAVKLLNRKIVVLDDDPTGIQTVHGVYVFTGWTQAMMEDGFSNPENIFYILTNSRSFSKQKTKKVHEIIAKEVIVASEKSGKNYIIISRSDSTLRGHYPLETETLRRTIESASGKKYDGEILIPFFSEGGRITVNNTHYLLEKDRLIPVSESEFAKDKSFGYKHAHLGEFVEEKTAGEYKAEECEYISINDLRSLKVDEITHQLMKVKDYGKIIVNAENYYDMKVFVIALVKAILDGKEYLFRSAASFPKTLSGIADKPYLKAEELVSPKANNGGIILIGSHVRKTTEQMKCLLNSGLALTEVEFNQHLVMDDEKMEVEVNRVRQIVDYSISQGRHVVVYTKRERYDLDTEDQEEQLRVSVKISDALTEIIKRLEAQPGFMITKGGITSSDIGTKAIGVQKAYVMGQAIPGVPVWMTGAESKFPHMPLIIFPGNVGDENALKDIVERLAGQIENSTQGK
ncbi:MAG: hydroxyacid dehydrogenase [Tindallia sp. MSAO_Bac2]|nr:MAG: hydroxyacid dehydrogenase [Tindallia sp. MSAO_Bac2]